MDMKELPNKIVEGSCSSELKNLSIDIGEFTLDQLIDDGILKDLPVVGTVAKLFKAGMDIRDRLFIAKVTRFLFSLKDVSESDRNIFREKIQRDKKLKQKIGSTLVLILDRLDELEKPDIIAKCFSYYISEKITFAQFKRLSSSVSIAFIDDLKSLLGSKENNDRYSKKYYEHLYKAGLTTIKGGDTWKTAGDIEYKISSLGTLFLNIMRDSFDKKPIMPSLI